jgi:hypothetical protein
MRRLITPALLLVGVQGSAHVAQTRTLASDSSVASVLQYPFDDELAAAEQSDVIAWVRNLNGMRNI